MLITINIYSLFICIYLLAIYTSTNKGHLFQTLNLTELSTELFHIKALFPLLIYTINNYTFNIKQFLFSWGYNPVNLTSTLTLGLPCEGLARGRSSLSRRQIKPLAWRSQRENLSRFTGGRVFLIILDQIIVCFVDANQTFRLQKRSCTSTVLKFS